MSAILIEPELRQVLEDVVRQSPDSSIFKSFTPTRFNKTFDLPDQTISIAQAGLGTAERELVRVHRDKLAWVLREAFLVNFYAGDGADWVTAPAHLPNNDELRAKATRIQNSASSAAYRYRTGHYLRRVTRGEPIAHPDDQSSLLLASLRLCDHPTGRVGLANLAMKRMDLRGVQSIVRNLLDRGDPHVSVYADRIQIKAFREAKMFSQADLRAVALHSFAVSSKDDGLAAEVMAESVLRRLRTASLTWERAVCGFDGPGTKADVLRLIREDWALKVIPSETRVRVQDCCS